MRSHSLSSLVLQCTNAYTLWQVTETPRIVSLYPSCARQRMKALGAVVIFSAKAQVRIQISRRRHSYNGPIIQWFAMLGVLQSIFHQLSHFTVAGLVPQPSSEGDTYHAPIQYVTTPTRPVSLETLDSVSNFVKMSQKVLQNFSLAVPIVTWRTTGHSSRTYSLQQLISMSPQKCQLQEFRFPGLQYQLKRQMLKRDRLLIKSKAHG